jgi:hypothetical protein
MPPVTRQMVSRPLESPRRLACEPCSALFSNVQKVSWRGGISSFTYETNLRSVTWTKVSLKEAKIRATPKTISPMTTDQQGRVEDGSHEYLRELEGLRRYSPWPGVRPSSWEAS